MLLSIKSYSKKKISLPPSVCGAEHYALYIVLLRPYEVETALHILQMKWNSARAMDSTAQTSGGGLVANDDHSHVHLHDSMCVSHIIV